MAPHIRDFLGMLDEVAPLRYAEKWDNPGLQVGGHSGPITSCAVALDPTMNALTRARELGAQVLLAHHPLLFRPVSRIDGQGYPGCVVHEAIRSRIHVVAAHTNLDAAEGGVNDILAGLLKVTGTTPLEEIAGCDGAGPGRVGQLPETVRLADLVDEVIRTLKADRVGVVGRGDREIRRVAVVGGSGGSMVAAAHRKGADCLITGDIGHHQALEAESMGMALLDAGHFRLEKEAFRIFARRLGKVSEARGWGTRFFYYEEEEDPIRWRMEKSVSER